MAKEAKIPFTLLPPGLLLRAAGRLAWLGAHVNAFTPNLKYELRQARFDVEPRDYAAAAFLNAAFNGWFIATLLAVVAALSRNSMPALIAIAGIAVAAASFSTAITFPRVVARRRAREVEQYLIPAVRQLVIELRSGVALFQAMASVSDDYGAVSEEFRHVVKRINAGVLDLDALAEASAASPSFEFHKVLWQISNALKVGSDIASALEGLLDELAQTRIAAIRSYGQELGPFAMVYMLAAVIGPSLGITMLLIILSFLDVSIPSIALAGILAGLATFQLLFLNFVISRRPSV